MKMILAAVAKEDAPNVTSALSRAGYPFTVMAGRGGFLGNEQEILLLAVNDMNVAQVVAAIKEECHSREMTVPDRSMGDGHAAPLKVTSDGAVVFVSDLDRFQRL
jgi:uncharacterized protein YaaQ